MMCLGATAAAFVLAVTATFSQPASSSNDARRFREELVHAKSSDGINNGGAMFMPPKEAAKPIAIIWVHGWGVNFYYPSYVNIGRALAERGFPCLTVNTRMHDIGTIAAFKDDKRIRGGGYWGATSEQDRDIAAWIEFARSLGYTDVVLAGHSAGSTAVRAYLANTEDRRVVGMVHASGAIRPVNRPDDAELLTQANKLVAEGKGEDLLRFPNRSTPSFISAATYLDLSRHKAEWRDFFGIESPRSPVERVQCPILAIYGTKEPDIGTEKDLELLKTTLQRLARGPRRVDTAMIQNAGHMYEGEEKQVGEIIAKWAESLETSPAGGK